MAASVALTLGVAVGGFEVTNINLVGNVAELGRPVDIVPFFVALVIYWLYRYYVFFRDTGDKGFKTAYTEVLQRQLNHSAIDFLRDNIHIVDPKAGDVVKIWASSAYLHEQYQRKHLTKFIRFDSIAVKYINKLGDYTDKGLAGNIDHELKNNRDRVILGKCQFVAAAHVLLNSHRFTEYVLPFLLAGSALLYWLIKAGSP